MSVVRVTRLAETFSGAIAALKEQVLHTVGRRRIEQQELIRIEVSLKPFDALAWLTSQRESIKIYWRDRQTGAEYAGIGAVEVITIATIDQLRQLCERISQHQESGCRWYGGMPFDTSREHHEKLGPFNAGKFVLPGIEVAVDGDAATLACNISIHDTQLYSRLACLSEIDENIQRVQKSVTVYSHLESASRESWNNAIEGILSAIATGAIEKLVPARQARIELAYPLDPWLALARLRAHSSGVTLFGFQFNDNQTFYGASPERLFRRHGVSIVTEAIAGTIARGSDHEQDARNTAQLLDSAKECREHRLVVEYIERSLRPLTDSFSMNEMEVLTLPHLHHLRTPIFGHLRKDVSDADVLSALHPTPAVAGSPRETALDLIRGMEPFNRGWYAGPVGWLGADATEFAVAIRSVLARGSELVLTAGAGIVEGSNPDAEWDETEQKIRSTLDVILP